MPVFCDTVTMDESIKPCPFCGEKATKLKHNDDLYRIKHSEHCWFAGKDFSLRASLIELDEVDKWNNRPKG